LNEFVLINQFERLPSSLPNIMKPPSICPSLTAKWHNASYDAISPTRPFLSAANRTIVITGASRRIGGRCAYLDGKRTWMAI